MRIFRVAQEMNFRSAESGNESTAGAREELNFFATIHRGMYYFVQITQEEIQIDTMVRKINRLSELSNTASDNRAKDRGLG